MATRERSLRVLAPGAGREIDRLAQKGLAEAAVEVSFEPLVRGIFATDASHYQIVPGGVVWPRDEAEVLQVLEVARHEGIPVTGRGAGTSLSGQTHGPGIVLDLSRHMNRVLRIDAEGHRAKVQPGAILDHVNAAAKEHGLHFAPDPATSSRATIGGMIANNSSGAHSVRFGKTSDNVDRLQVALIDGTVLSTERLGADAWAQRCSLVGREGELYAGLSQIVESRAETIRGRYPKVMRRVAGYALDQFLPELEERTLSDIFCGSEGTLGLTLEADLVLEPLAGATALCLVEFDDLVESLRHLELMLEHSPVAIELLDDVILDEARQNAATAGAGKVFQGQPRAIQIVELVGDTAEEAAARAEDFAADMERRSVGTARSVFASQVEQRMVWDTRKLGLGLISNRKGSQKGQAFIEDACVPLPYLAEYVDRVLTICREEELPVSVYAHASVGVLHTRPMLDLHLPEHIDKMKRIADQAFEMVQEYGGCWSGEHGDGLVRGEFIERFYGSEIMRGLRETKRLFDPPGLLNPGKVIDPPSMTEHLRYQVDGYGESTQATAERAQFAYEDQGGFALAVEQCNGVGACRKIGSGVMCPSYMATRLEEHSTRGRANALRLAMSGQMGDPREAMASDELHEVLGLCLACKACKSECPNAVDMARLKADALYMRHRERGPSLKARLISALPKVAAFSSGPLAPIANFGQSLPPVRALVERFGGIDRRRPLPRFSTRRFGKGDSVRATQGAEPVLLYADTYSRFYDPAAGKAAVELLRDAGFAATVITPGDSGRPALSQGMLDVARRGAERLYERLERAGARDLPVICLEPSCASALADDLPDLLGTERSQAIGGQVVLLEHFLVDQVVQLEPKAEHLFIHEHCHQRAVFGAIPWQALLPAGSYTLSDAGCCGMAGSFGYEHADVSLQVAEDRLLPNLRRAQDEHSDLAVVAAGFSCRHQLEDEARTKPRSLAEVVKVAGQ
ncbi:MAG: FAD-binding and (Fe-S)-binding domain-containing protein [Acidobacteriota bacterium]